MKKLILSIFMVSALASFAEGNTVDVRAGFDFNSKSKVKDGESSFDLLKSEKPLNSQATNLSLELVKFLNSSNQVVLWNLQSSNSI